MWVIQAAKMANPMAIPIAFSIASSVAMWSLHGTIFAYYFLYPRHVKSA
jgi:hypothetical protein